MAVPSAMVGETAVGTASSDPAMKGGGDRRTIGRLGSEDPRQCLNQTGPQQLGKTDLTAQHIRPGTQGVMMLSGIRKPRFSHSS